MPVETDRFQIDSPGSTGEIPVPVHGCRLRRKDCLSRPCRWQTERRSEEHTSELQSLRHLVCRLLLEKKNASLALPLHEADRLLAAEKDSFQVDCFFFFKSRATHEYPPFPPHAAFPV